VAVEAMIASLIPRDGRLLVLENGAYGERMADIAGLHGIPVRRVAAAWGEPVPLSRVREALATGEPVTHVAVVQHETSTGRLNPVEELAGLCRERGAELLVDAVSSFGAEELALDAWGIGACAGTAGKCLHAIPGLCFALVRRSALDATCSPPRSLYLDLARHHREQDASSTAFTPAVQAFHALAEALREHAEQGGWRARHRRYAELAERIARDLAALGVEPYLAAGDSSVVLRSYRLPPGMGYERLHDELKKRGFVIYAGQGELRRSLFRISTLGEISDADVERLSGALREILQGQGRAGT
jgi:2-aminoethylphosphonate-pyruvate transaminase